MDINELDDVVDSQLFLRYNCSGIPGEGNFPVFHSIHHFAIET